MRTPIPLARAITHVANQYNEEGTLLSYSCIFNELLEEGVGLHGDISPITEMLREVSEKCDEHYKKIADIS